MRAMDAMLATIFASNQTMQCDSAAVAAAMPLVPGVSVLQVTAVETVGPAAADVVVMPNLVGKSSSSEPAGTRFCNVTVAYTHPSWGDEIGLSVYLPLAGWNGRFVATGGSGWTTGPSEGDMLGAVSLGYAAAGTDGGHAGADVSWALRDTATGPLVNLPLLVDFASQALAEMVQLGRPLAEAFFGGQQPTAYTYWAGCSTGGRQGLMMAQRHAGLFDGILANAPAIHWPQFVVAELWPQVVMHETATRPPACVLDAMTRAGIAACDGLDGLLDGIVSAPGRCAFDPYALVGQTAEGADCGSSPVTITAAHAHLVQKMLLGPHATTNSTAGRLWYGLHPGADLTWLAGTAGCGSSTNASANCTAVPFSVARDYVVSFLAKDAALDTTAVSYAQFDAFFAQSAREYDWIIGTSDADLRHLRSSGTKLLTFHGLADQLIFPNGTAAYYDRVLAADPGAADYYRFFEAPGVSHCAGGIGPNPNGMFLALRDWVENGSAPTSLDGVATAANGTVGHRPLCLYPQVAAYQGGDPGELSSYQCQADF